MISQHAIESAKDLLIPALKHGGKCIKPVASSPVAGLLNALGGISSGFTGTDTATALGKMQEQSDLRNSVNGSYDEIMEEVAKEASNSISRILRFISNEVNPNIERIVNWVDQELAAKSIVGVADIPIYQEEGNEYCSNELLMSILKEYDGFAPRLTNPSSAEVVESMLLKFSQTVDLGPLVMTGSAPLDDIIKKNIPSTIPSVNKLATGNGNINDSIYLFLLLRALLDNANQDVTTFFDANVATRNAFMEVTQVLGKLILSKCSMYSSILATGKILMPDFMKPEEMKTKACIYVIGRNYRAWLDKGGSPEAIRGLHIYLKELGSKAAGFDDTKVLNNPEMVTEFVKTYNQALQMGEIKVANQKSDYLNRAPWESQIFALIDVQEIDEQAKNERKQRVVEFIKMRKHVNIPLYAVLGEVICLALVEGSDVVYVIRAMDRFIHDNRERINSSEIVDRAATYAVYKLIGQWVSAQVEVASI